MSSLIQLAEALSLSELKKKELAEWAVAKAKEANISPEYIEASLTKWHQEAEKVNLHEKMQIDMYIEYLQSMVIGDIAEIGTKVETMVIGYNQPRKWSSGEVTCDLICRVKKEDTIYPTILTASGDEVYRLINEVTFFNVYKTEIRVDRVLLEDNPPVMRATALKTTTFAPANVVKAPSWTEDTREKRVQEILSQYPTVPLMTANQHLSQSVSPQIGKPYIDPIDLKTIMVTIKSFRMGRRKDYSEWGLLGVVDNKFVPTADYRFFTVWIDPNIVRKINAGVNSYVVILGTLAFDDKQKLVTMNGCCIVPIKIVPLQIPAANLGGTGGVQNLSM